MSTSIHMKATRDQGDVSCYGRHRLFRGGHPASPTECASSSQPAAQSRHHPLSACVCFRAHCLPLDIYSSAYLPTPTVVSCPAACELANPSTLRSRTDWPPGGCTRCAKVGLQHS